MLKSVVCRDFIIIYQKACLPTIIAITGMGSKNSFDWNLDGIEEYTKWSTKSFFYPFYIKIERKNVVTCQPYLNFPQKSGHKVANNDTLTCLLENLIWKGIKVFESKSGE